MIKWIPYELHCHTNHSDGAQALSGLGENAMEIGFGGIALTDHNTISAFDEISSVKEKNSINIINGLEWTTFYGHVLLLGAYKYFDWRGLKPNNLDEKLLEPKSEGVLIGLAHPFRVGNPMNTGCFMEYAINDWSNIDYIEVWSGTSPGNKYENKKAYELWTKRLNEGYRISAVSGRDWHRYEETTSLISSTYIGIDSGEENNNEAVLKAIRKGRLVVSSSMLLELSVTDNENTWNIGDTVQYYNSILKVNIDIKKGKINNNYVINEGVLSVKIMSNKGCIKDIQHTKDTINIEIDNNLNDLKWVRAELYRELNNVVEFIAFTNPIYFK